MRPRFFVASSTSVPPPPDRDEPGVLRDALALCHLGPTELVIGTDSSGRLRAADAAQRGALSARVQAQLSFHEVAGGRALAPRATELHLFDVQLVEIPRDAPGANDPVYLYGQLRGPYPAAVSEETESVDGQLTVTRADLLGGLVAGVEDAFLHERGMGGSRCVHAFLPGAPAQEIAEGRGLVLAFPLAHLELTEEPPNELLVAQILYDVLAALRADLGEDAGALAVPSRRALEERLIADGWSIDGDTASRRRRGGVIGRLFKKDERALPRQGTLEDYLADARLMLARLRVPSPIVPPPRPTVPTPPPAPPSGGIPQATPRPRIKTPRNEWMKDFIDAHRTPEHKPPRLAAPARVLSPAAVPDWMHDFSEPAPKAKPEEPEEADWSKDFE